ncbi:NAD(P)/FAD-dependent oxidoreductase [Paenibacillus sp. TRM 82003]|nr:NAD(P)/FAD-dependent oxidoreductase [Paenibacillus sp. TRM 82003]
MMKIAVMGAGLSGLACAITLEKCGVQPAIFERRGRVGDRFVNGEALLSIYTQPVHDCIASLSEQYGIYLKPTGNIQRMIVYSKHEQAIIEGQLGHTNIRGREEDSFESQLARQVNSPIQFNSERTYEELLRDYTHVILATGDSDYAKKTRNFREDLKVSIKGKTVEGSFDRYEVRAWMDYDIAPYGYGYLIPFSEKEANVVIALPDIPKNAEADIEALWERYYMRVQEELKQPLRITDGFRITGYPMGICRSARIGNTFYVGNCFGSMMPFMGFGQYVAILTGIYAAYDLCGIGRYEELTRPLRQSYENSLVMRRAMETVSNDGLDRVVRMMQGRLGDKLFQTKTLDPLKWASYLLRPYIKLKRGVTS